MHLLPATVFNKIKLNHNDSKNQPPAWPRSSALQMSQLQGKCYYHDKHDSWSCYLVASYWSDYHRVSLAWNTILVCVLINILFICSIVGSILDRWSCWCCCCLIPFFVEGCRVSLMQNLAYLLTIILTRTSNIIVQIATLTLESILDAKTTSEICQQQEFFH